MSESEIFEWKIAEFISSYPIGLSFKYIIE